MSHGYKRDEYVFVKIVLARMRRDACILDRTHNPKYQHHSTLLHSLPEQISMQAGELNQSGVLVDTQSRI